MAFVKLPGKFVTNEDDCFIAINTDNLTFVTPGPSESARGKVYQQLFFHFTGNIESIGFWVEDVEESLQKLGLG